MLIVDRLGGGGSFTELQALNFATTWSRWATTARPTCRSATRRPLLRGLGVYHGKRGWGVSVEFDVKHGPVTTFGIAQQRDGSFRFVASDRHGRAGPAAADRQHHLAGRLRLRPRRVDRRVERDRHLAPLGARRRATCSPELRATADLLGVELVEVAP